MKITDEVRNAMVDAAVDLIDTGTGAGTITVYSGTRPATISTASTTALSEHAFSATSFGAASAGAAAAAAIADDTDANASGDATYARIRKGAGADTAAIMEVSAGETADTPELVFNNKTIVAGGTVTIDSITITQPAGA